MDNVVTHSEPDYSSMSDEELMGYVFSSGGVWYPAADREMHRRLVAGRNKLLAGQKDNAWGELLVKIVTLVVNSNSHCHEVLDKSTHDVAELVSDFMLELVNRDAWTTYDCKGKLASYLVGQSSPLRAALNIVQNPRRKQSDEPIRTVLSGDISVMESIAAGDGTGDSVGPMSAPSSDDTSVETGQPEETEVALGDCGEGASARPNCSKTEARKAVRAANSMLLDHKAKIGSFSAELEKRDLVGPGRRIFYRTAKGDPDGARAYCLFAYGRNDVDVGKFDDEAYQRVLMGSCGLPDRTIAKLMGKSEAAVTKARSRFLRNLRECGEQFFKNESLGAMARAATSPQTVTRVGK